MSLHDSAMLVSLSLSRLGLNRKDEDEAKEVARRHGGDSKSFGVTKRLLQGNPAFDLIRKFDAALGVWHRKQTVAWGDDGTRLLPTVGYADYTAYLRQSRSDRDVLVQQFLHNYDTFVTADRAALGSAFNSADYPDRYAVRERFSFSHSVTPVPDAKDFRIEMGRKEMAELKQGVDQRIREAEDLARRDLMGRLAEPLQKMADALGNTDRKLTLNTTVPLVENLKEILDMIPRLNITGDTRIEDFRRIATEKLAGITAETLKTNPLVRGVAAAKAQSIVDAMSDFMGPAQVPLAA